MTTSRARRFLFTLVVLLLAIGCERGIASDSPASAGRETKPANGRPRPLEPAVNVAAGQTVQGVLRPRLGARHGQVAVFAFSPDGRSLMTTGERPEVTVWDLAKGEPAAVLTVPEKRGKYIHYPRNFAISPDGKILVRSAPGDRAILWDLPGRKERHKIDVPSLINRVAFTADSKVLFVLAGKIVYRHDAETGARQGASAKVTDRFGQESLAIAPDGSTVAVGTANGEVVVMDGKSLKVKKRFPGNSNGSTALAVSPDGKSLASVTSEDKQIKLFDLTKLTTRSIACEGADVPSITFSPSGKLLALCGREIHLIDVASGKMLGRLAPPAGSIDEVAFSPDGSLLAGLSRSRNDLALWDLSAGLEARSVPRPDQSQSVALDPKGARAAVRVEGGLALISLTDGKVERKLPTTVLLRPAFSPDGGLLAYCPDESKVSLMEVGTGKERDSIPLKPGVDSGSALHFAPDGKRLLLSGDRKVQHWDVSGRPRALAVLDKINHSYQSLTVSPDGSRLALAMGPNLRVIDSQTGKPVWTATAHEGPIASVVFSADGKRIVTASPEGVDRAARLWDAANGKLVGTFRPGAKPLAARFAGRDTVVTICPNGEFHAFDAATGRLIGRRGAGRVPRDGFVLTSGGAVLLGGEKEYYPVEPNALTREAFVGRAGAPRLEPPAEPRLTFAPVLLRLGDFSGMFDNSSFWFSGDGKRLISVTHDTQFWLRSLPGGELTGSFRFRAGLWPHRAMSDDGRRMAIGCSDGSVHLIDLASGTEERVLRKHKGPVGTLAFSRDGKWLASATSALGEPELLLWDVVGDKLEKELARGPERPGPLAFTPDGKQLIVGVERALHRFLIPSGTKLAELPYPDLPELVTIDTVAVSRDGKLLAAGGGISVANRGEVVVWDAATGKPLHTLTGHGVGDVKSLTFGPGGLLAVGQRYGGTHFWDTAGGKEIGHLRESLFALSPDGKTAVTSGTPVRESQHVLRDLSYLRDDRLQAALAPVTALEAEVSRSDGVVRVELKSIGPDAVAALTGLASLPGPLDLKLHNPEWLGEEAVAALSALKSLRRLELDRSGLRDEHLKRLAALPGLEALRITTSSKVTPKGLTALAAATRLVELEVEGTPLEPGTLRALLPLTKLRSLRLGAALAEEDLTTLARFPDLAELSFVGWDGAEEGIPSLGAMKSLRRLAIQGVPMTGKTAAAVGALSELTELDLKVAQVDDASLSHLKGLTNLRRLGLWSANITDDGLKHLVGMTKLTSLVLDGTEKVTGSGLAHLGKAAGLTALKLDRTGVTDAGLAGLKGWAHLRELTLPDRVTDAGLLHLDGLTRLESINLPELRKVKGPGLAGLRNAKGLTELDLSRHEINDDGLEGLKDWTHLRVLKLPKAITNAGVARLAALTELRVLHLAEAKGFTDAGLKHLRGMKQLDSLDLSETGVSDKGVPDLEAMKALRWLRLSDPAVTDAGREKLRKARPGVDIISY